jgi:hypothetical protein
MRELAKKLGMSRLLRLATLVAATTSLGGCATLYDDYYGDSYYDNAYSNYNCDPYSPFDRYYDCDYRNGFFNIGFGGGWYNNYYYPGYGFYLFDRGGRRYDMDNQYRRYWGGQRHEYWRQYRGQHGGGGRHGYGRSGSGGFGQIGWPEQHGGRINEGNGYGRDHDRRDEGYGRHDERRDDDRHDRRRRDGGSYGNPQYGNGQNRGDGRGYGRGGQNQPQQPAPVYTAPQDATPQPEQPFRHPRNGNAGDYNPDQGGYGRGGRRGGDGDGDGGGRGRRGGGGSGYQPSGDTASFIPAPAPIAQAAQPSPQPMPQPRAEPSEPRPERSSPPAYKLGGNSGERIDED